MRRVETPELYLRSVKKCSLNQEVKDQSNVIYNHLLINSCNRNAQVTEIKQGLLRS